MPTEKDNGALYQVIGWDSNFEGSKSKTYNNKSSCQMPTKHGLGYKRLVRRDNGPALFGAWCAMIQILSRHPKPRQGYLTDSGLPDGIPMLPSDLEILTDIPESVFDEMLQVCSDQKVGWLRILQGYCKDTARGAQYPLNSNSDLDSNSDSDKDLTANDYPLYSEKINQRWKALYGCPYPYLSRDIGALRSLQMPDEEAVKAASALGNPNAEKIDMTANWVKANILKLRKVWEDIPV